jgi:hypothetical protein
LNVSIITRRFIDQKTPKSPFKKSINPKISVKVLFNSSTLLQHATQPARLALPLYNSSAREREQFSVAVK